MMLHGLQGEARTIKGASIMDLVTKGMLVTMPYQMRGLAAHAGHGRNSEVCFSKFRDLGGTVRERVLSQGCWNVARCVTQCVP